MSGRLCEAKPEAKRPCYISVGIYRSQHEPAKNRKNILNIRKYFLSDVETFWMGCGQFWKSTPQPINKVSSIQALLRKAFRSPAVLYIICLPNKLGCSSGSSKPFIFNTNLQWRTQKIEWRGTNYQKVYWEWNTLGTNSTIMNSTRQQKILESKYSTMVPIGAAGAKNWKLGLKIHNFDIFFWYFLHIFLKIRIFGKKITDSGWKTAPQAKNFLF